LGGCGKHAGAVPTCNPASADDKIELERFSTLEGDGNAFLVLFYAIQAIAKDHFDFAVDGVKYRRSKIPSRKTGKAPPCHAGKCVRRESSQTFAAWANDSYLPDHISFATDLRQQAYAACDVVACAPEINAVAASAEVWRRFCDGGFVSVTQQPVGKGRAADSRTGNQNFHG
jgi:hypothetical protein